MCVDNEWLIVLTLAVEREHLPVVGDTGCSHTADNCRHKLLQSGRSPMESNTQNRPAAAGGTGCTGRSRFCMLSWTAMIYGLTAVAAAAACSLNSRGRKQLSWNPPINCFLLQTQINQLALRRGLKSLRTYLLAARLSLRGLPPSPTAPWHSSNARFCSRSSGNWTKPQPLQRDTAVVTAVVISFEGSLMTSPETRSVQLTSCLE